MKNFVEWQRYCHLHLSGSHTFSLTANISHYVFTTFSQKHQSEHFPKITIKNFSDTSGNEVLLSYMKNLHEFPVVFARQGRCVSKQFSKLVSKVGFESHIIF